MKDYKVEVLEGLKAIDQILCSKCYAGHNGGDCLLRDTIMCKEKRILKQLIEITERSEGDGL